MALTGSGDVIAVRLGARSLPNVFVGVTLVRGDGGGKPPLWRQGLRIPARSAASCTGIPLRAACTQAFMVSQASVSGPNDLIGFTEGVSASAMSCESYRNRHSAGRET